MRPLSQKVWPAEKRQMRKAKAHDSDSTSMPCLTQLTHTSKAGSCQHQAVGSTAPHEELWLMSSGPWAPAIGQNGSMFLQ